TGQMVSRYSMRPQEPCSVAPPARAAGALVVRVSYGRRTAIRVPSGDSRAASIPGTCSPSHLRTTEPSSFRSRAFPLTQTRICGSRAFAVGFVAGDGSAFAGRSGLGSVASATRAAAAARALSWVAYMIRETPAARAATRGGTESETIAVLTAAAAKDAGTPAVSPTAGSTPARFKPAASLLRALARRLE